MSDIAAICDTLAELQYRRKFYIGTTNKQTNAAKALVRRMLGWYAGDGEAKREAVNKRAARIVAAAMSGKDQKLEDAEIAEHLSADLEVIALASVPLTNARKRIESDMRKMVRDLPAYEFVKSVHGFGDLGFAVIVGEAGNLSDYANPAKVWKRLGLAPMNGRAASTWRMKGGLTAEDWTAFGYSPRRRAEIHSCISDPLFRQQTVAQGVYRLKYDQRRERTAETHPDWTKAHSHADALRIMTKALVCDLWAEWGRAGQTMKSWVVLPVSTHETPVLVAAE